MTSIAIATKRNTSDVQWRIVSIFTVVAVNFVALLHPVSSSNPTEFRLLKDLFDNSTFDKRVRPATADNAPISVGISYWLLGIVELEEHSQTLTLTGWLDVTWKDPDMQWDKDGYDGQDYLTVDADSVWTPDIIIRNSADSVYGDSFLQPSTYRLTIYSDGSLDYWMAGQTNTRCSLDLKFFPFDRQTCYIEFRSWTYTVAQVVYANMSNRPEMSLYKLNDQWNIEDSEVKVFIDNFGGYLYSNVRFVYYLRRKPLFFVMTLIFPCVVLSSISLLVFLLPPETGEKVSLSITILLSYTVFQLTVVDALPETSDYIPIIVIYLVCSMIQSALSLICTVIVLRFRHHRATKLPPKWLRRLLLHYVATCICKRHKGQRSVDSISRRSSVSNFTYPESVGDSASTSASFSSSSNERQERNDKLNYTQDNNSSSRTKDKATNERPTDNTTSGKKINDNIRVPELNGCIPGYAQTRSATGASSNHHHHHHQQLVADVAAEWQEMSRVLDIFFFVIFLVATVVMSIVLLLWYPRMAPTEFAPVETL